MEKGRFGNRHYIKNGVAVLEILHSYGVVFSHIYDVDLYPIVSNAHWGQHYKGYAEGRVNGKKVYLHQVGFIERPEGLQVDHIDRNKCDSRGQNLRLVTPRQNQMNKSNVSIYGYGIQFHRNRYIVRTSFKGDNVYRPSFKSLEAATECRDKFVEIAMSMDAGDRKQPTPFELRTIADNIRFVYGDN